MYSIFTLEHWLLLSKIEVQGSKKGATVHGIEFGVSRAITFESDNSEGGLFSCQEKKLFGGVRARIGCA